MFKLQHRNIANHTLECDLVLEGSSVHRGHGPIVWLHGNWREITNLSNPDGSCHKQMYNTSAVAKEAHPQGPGKCPPWPSSTARIPTMNSTTGGPQAWEPGLEQTASNHGRPRSRPNAVPKAKGAGQKARARTDRMLAGFPQLTAPWMSIWHEDNRPLTFISI